MTRPLLALAVMFLLGASSTLGQQTEAGSVRGLVVAQGGEPVDGVRILVRGAGVRVLTGGDGTFLVGPLTAGQYVIEIQRIGFRPARRTVTVNAGRVTELRIELVPAPISVDAIVVSALADQSQRTRELSGLLRVPPVGAGNVTTVTSQEIREVQASDPWVLVRETTGLEIHQQGQGPGFASDAVIRGFTSDHSADVALVLDGIPINEPINGHGEGYADWNVIFPGAVADLQVIKGPVSPLFGNFAAGGAVNVTTRATAEQTEVTLEGGSFNTGAATAVTGFRQGPWGGFFGGNLVRTSGWRDNSDYTLGQLLARLNRRMSRTLLLDAAFHYYGTDWASPGYVSVPEFNAGRVAHAADPTDGGDKRRAMAWLTAQVSGEAVEWQTRAWGYNSRWHLFLNIPELGGEGEGIGSQTEEFDVRTAVGVRSLARWAGGRWEAIAGVEAQRHDAAYDLYGTTSRERDSTLSRYDSDFTNLAALAGVTGTFGRTLRLDVGLRGDLLRANTADVMSGSAMPSETHHLLSPKLGAVVYLSPVWQIYGTAARGFRTVPGLISDPRLVPMTVWDFEVGTRFAQPRFDIALSLFRLETDNERLFNPITLQVESEGRSTREGVELAAAVHPLRRLDLSTRWTLNTRGLFVLPVAEGPESSGSPVLGLAGVGGTSGAAAALHHPDDVVGERVPGVSDYVGRVSLMVRPIDRVSLHAWVTVIGPYVPLGEPEVVTQPYTIGNLLATIFLNRRLEAVVGVTNLFDAHAAEIRASGFINPAAPRAIRIRVTTRL